MTDTVAWVIGARGLLGSALSRAIDARPAWRRLESDPLPWESDELADAARATAGRLADSARRCGSRIAVLWCGGRGVTSSDDAHFEGEHRQLETVLAAVAAVLADRGEASDVLFYASSAGGIYAGAANPPHTEDTPPAPIAPYGRAKLRAEDTIRSVAERAGTSSLVGRLSNLYGPGQSLGKPQGIISHLARSRFTRRPLSVYVPLDTLRDYLYVDDAAALVLDAVDRAARLGASGGRHDATKILASGTAATIGEVLGAMRQVTRARPPVTLGRSADADRQAADLRLRSVVWSDLDQRAHTPLPVGIAATLEDVLTRSAGL